MSLSYMAPNRYTAAMVIPTLALSDRRGRGGGARDFGRDVPSTSASSSNNQAGRGAPRPPAHPAGVHRAASLVATVRRRSAYY